MKRVVSLVGMLGVGKTTTIKALSNIGYDTLNEDYIDVARNFPCDNRMILSKWAYISNWFYKVERHFLENPTAKTLFVDRGVIEAGIWTATCKPLFEPIMISLKEFKLRGYEVINICLKVDNFDVLQERIKRRLTIEPERLQFNEGNFQFLQDLYRSYAENEWLWDFVLNTQDTSTAEICVRITNFLQSQSHKK